MSPDSRPAEFLAPDSIGFLHAPVATLVLSERMVLRANAMVERVFGWRPEEIEGKSMRLLYPGQTDFEQIGARAQRAFASDDICRDERLMRRKNGQIVWMEGRGRTLDRGDPFRLAVWTYVPLEEVESDGPETLTAAEKMVAKYLVNGFTSKEIAQTLARSPRTIEAHRANMMRKMRARNASELVRSLLNMQGE
ncbi:LuxR C-terminal-related transcriptional regulator [Paracoccus aminophilus]|uniref:Transcriptional regulator, LysR family n=1 Tax=Paracoccus aminophilus JCM 7686 TaxID=1367847 RepID=S5Y7B8_PARAH|nr:LuxR C-terminal-related transcriptional regulator [Paracoccus aminophilus]AGT11420.1 transcriptional regulator, LysR family [Paracoccus aminophilus JCM 7686]